MASHSSRLSALEKRTSLGQLSGSVEFHAIHGSNSTDYRRCDRREEHGADCVFRVVSRNRSGRRFIRLYGFDPALLD